MTIYTRRGDEGHTDLYSGERVAKTHPRVEACGTIDELNALLGVVRSAPGEMTKSLSSLLVSIQNDLHSICARLSSTKSEGEQPGISRDRISTLEEECDWFEEQLQRLQEFILPGGAYRASLLHHARTVCRRAERRTIEAAEKYEVDSVILAYLNRLSDLLFLMARYVNHLGGHKERKVQYSR